MVEEAAGGDGVGGTGGSGGNVIIIKKKSRGGHAGHHGGAWKVAYADFVTAMMAFFLLLWLLSTTSKEQKEGIAYYFNRVNASMTTGGGVGIGGGNNLIDTKQQAPHSSPNVPAQPDSAEDVALKANEDAMFRQISEELKKAVMNIPQLKALLENLLIDITPEGLRITITDSQGRELFENGNAKMFPYTEQMIGVVANVVAALPNELALGGHTDSVPYRGDNPAYSNWELSGDRANEMRKVLMREGIKERRVNRVAGYASQTPLLPDQPENIKNRRLTVVVLRSKRGTVAKFDQEGLVAPNRAEVK